MREISIGGHQDHGDRTEKRYLDAITDDPLHLLPPDARQRLNQIWQDAWVPIDSAIRDIVEHYGDDRENWHPDAHQKLALVKVKAAVTALTAMRQEFEAIAKTISSKIIDEELAELLEAPRPLELLEAGREDYFYRFLGGLELTDEDEGIVLATLDRAIRPGFDRAGDNLAKPPHEPPEIDREALYQSWLARQPEPRRGAQTGLLLRLKITRGDLARWRKRKKFKDDGDWSRRLVDELRLK